TGADLSCRRVASASTCLRGPCQAGRADLVPQAEAVREVVAGDRAVGGCPGTERPGSSGGLVGAEEGDVLAEAPVDPGPGLGAQPDRGVHPRSGQPPPAV